MSGKLGKRLLYLGLPAVGIAFCLYYLSIATKDVAYTDYMRLIVSYLPDVANPAKFFVPDVLTRVPITYLGRIINVDLFHYSTTFDMVLGVISHGLAALALASYCRDKKGYGSWFLVIMLLMFSLNKWEMLGNGSGWVCFLSIAGFYWNFVILDRMVFGRERKYDRILLKALPAFLTLLVAGPYCGSYSLIMTMAYCALLISDYRKNRRINSEWAVDLAFVLGALGLYLLSNHFAVYEYRGATEATLVSTLLSEPKFFVKFILEAFASPIIGIEVVSKVIKTSAGVCLLGMVVICFYLLAFWLNVKYRLWEKTILPLMLILIGGVNHALVVYSRWIFLQENYGMASRYAIQYEMGIFGILLTFAAVFAIKKDRKHVLAVAAGGFICLLLAGNFYTTREELLKAPLRRLSLEQTIETALDYKNKTDEELGAQLHTNGERARKALEILDENNLNIFYQEGAE